MCLREGRTLSPEWQVPASIAFVTGSNRPQPLWQPPPTTYLTASGAASDVPSLLMHPGGGGGRPPPPPCRPPWSAREGTGAHQYTGRLICIANSSGRRPAPGSITDPSSVEYTGTRSTAPSTDALEEKGRQRRPQKQLDRWLEEVAKAVGGGYCRLQMLLKLAFAIRGTVAGQMLGTPRGGGGGAPPPSNASLQAEGGGGGSLLLVEANGVARKAQ